MRRQPCALFVGAVVGLGVLAASPAWSWGHEGHRIVALVAARNLSAAARSRIAIVLGTNDAGLDAAMADAATWPDEINKRRTGTRDWHFIDVPVTSPFNVAGLCPHHDCVIDRIEEMKTRLQTNQGGFTLVKPPTPPRPMTSQEMAFLIHFVGDIHQPLHAATDGDMGGNCVTLAPTIVHGPHEVTTELHAFWDNDEVLAVMARHGNDEGQTADALFQLFKSGASVPQATTLQWAHDSNDLARQQIYQKLNLPNHTAPAGQCAAGISAIAIPAGYIADTVATAEQQLLRAGIRLSVVLNTICTATGCTANPKKKAT